MDFELIAEIKLFAVFRDGTSRRVRLALGKPYEAGDGNFACLVAGEGVDALDDGPRPVYGVDSWQALMLARQFLRIHVVAEIEAGATFHWPDDTHVTDVVSLFGDIDQRGE